jgi:hypothetical protein
MTNTSSERGSHFGPGVPRSFIRLVCQVGGILVAGGCLLLALTASRRALKAADVVQASVPLVLFLVAALPVEWLRRRQTSFAAWTIVGANLGLVLAIAWTLRAMTTGPYRQPFPALGDLIVSSLPAAAWTVPVCAILLMAGRLGYQPRGSERAGP